MPVPRVLLLRANLNPTMNVMVIDGFERPLSFAYTPFLNNLTSPTSFGQPGVQLYVNSESYHTQRLATFLLPCSKQKGGIIQILQRLDSGLE